MKWQSGKQLANRRFIIERSMETSIHHQSQADQELPAPNWIE